LLEEGTVLDEEEQGLLLFYANEITRAVESGKMNLPHVEIFPRAA
jgi:hypothetical protein